RSANHRQSLQLNWCTNFTAANHHLERSGRVGDNGIHCARRDCRCAVRCGDRAHDLATALPTHSVNPEQSSRIVSEAAPGSARQVRLGGASMLMASGTIVSRALGFIKVAVLAAAIGQTGSASADAFGLASQLPNNVYALIAGGVLSAVLI